MPLGHPERRRLARLPLEVLAQIRIPEKGLIAFAETRNVSAQGIYLHTYADQQGAAELEPGEDVECILVLPEKLTLTDEPVFVACLGQIRRVNKDLPERCTGVAIEVHSFDFAWHGDLLQAPAPGT
jgi:hypothetical protein